MFQKRTIGNLIYSLWDILFIKLGFFVSTFRSLLSLFIQGCPTGGAFSTSGKCHFKAYKSNSIHIGKNVTLLSGWRSNRVGLSNDVLIQTFGNARIEIGDGSGGSGVVISSRSFIKIGKNVNLGGNVRIFDHDFHALDAKKRTLPMNKQESHIRSEPIFIGDNVFIGTNAIILKGVTIGARSIVAAGSVVFRGNYPTDSLISGNPATIRQS